MKRYWTENLAQELSQVASVEEMRDFALKLLNMIDGDIGMVTGPIGSGGLGSREKNLERFQKVIDERYEEGNAMFDQMPFQEKIKYFYDQSGGDKMVILEGFYLPLFKTGKIKKFYFIPDWQSSIGATWEHDRAKELGIEIIYLDK